MHDRLDCRVARATHDQPGIYILALPYLLLSSHHLQLKKTFGNTTILALNSLKGYYS